MHVRTPGRAEDRLTETVLLMCCQCVANVLPMCCQCDRKKESARERERERARAREREREVSRRMHTSNPCARTPSPEGAVGGDAACVDTTARGVRHLFQNSQKSVYRDFIQFILKYTRALTFEKFRPP
jgi:hypothetical protein